MITLDIGAIICQKTLLFLSYACKLSIPYFTTHDFSPCNYSVLLTNGKWLYHQKYLHIFVIFSILVRVSEGSLDTKSVSLPPINFFPNLYGYFKRPDNGIRKTRSEPAQPRKKIVKTFRSKVRFLPPVATLYPEKDQDETVS